jgi:N-acyl-D-aspartate/D-glutamate deacylase
MGQGVPHPRNYGTFPRKIRQYVLEEKVIGLADAIRSMSSLPATVFGLPGRGVMRPGAVADLVVFDLETLTDRATYRQPHQLSEGMVHVLVNGHLALEEGVETGVLAGKVLSRTAIPGATGRSQRGKAAEEKQGVQ